MGNHTQSLTHTDVCSLDQRKTQLNLYGYVLLTYLYLQTGWSLADSAKKYGITLASLEAEVERRAKAKRNEVLTPKVDFVYESAQMEDAVNSVLCGTSIKDAASAYGVSKNSLKQVILYCCIMMHSHVIQGWVYTGLNRFST